MKHWALLLLLIGMSAAAQGTAFRIEGEIIAGRSVAVSPPAVQDVFQFNIAEIAPEGSTVKAGDVVVRFALGDLSRQLLESQNKLAEQTREREQLLLALEDRERKEALATAEARADLDKASRKASQSQQGVIRAIEYRKLVVERERTERRLALQIRREKLARRLRLAELQLVETEISRLQSEVDRLTASISGLSVKTPIAGMMLYRTDFGGAKFAVGSQVWMGVAVAEISDTASLAVRAELPERELRRISVGDAARVQFDTAAVTALQARLVRLGRVVHSKSRVQPIPVMDLYLEFERKAVDIRPGQPVRVELNLRDRKTIPVQAN